MENCLAGTRTVVDAYVKSINRATAGLSAAPELLTTDWLLGQFGGSRATAQQRYREFVKEGLENRPWDNLKGQIYLGSEKFIESHAPKTGTIKEVPRAQVPAVRPTLDQLLGRNSKRGIVRAYREHGYRLSEIAAHLGVHYATVSRRLKQLERHESGA